MFEGKRPKSTDLSDNANISNHCPGTNTWRCSQSRPSTHPSPHCFQSLPYICFPMDKQASPWHWERPWTTPVPAGLVWGGAHQENHQEMESPDGGAITLLTSCDSPCCAGWWVGSRLLHQCWAASGKPSTTSEQVEVPHHGIPPPEQSAACDDVLWHERGQGWQVILCPSLSIQFNSQKGNPVHHDPGHKAPFHPPHKIFPRQTRPRVAHLHNQKPGGCKAHTSADT